MSNTKLNVYKNVLQEVCEKFNGAEEYIKERIVALSSESKFAKDEVTYLFTNDYNNYEAVLFKSYKHYFECSVIIDVFWFGWGVGRFKVATCGCRKIKWVGVRIKLCWSDHKF